MKESREYKDYHVAVTLDDTVYCRQYKYISSLERYIYIIYKHLTHELIVPFPSLRILIINYKYYYLSSSSNHIWSVSSDKCSQESSILLSGFCGLRRSVSRPFSIGCTIIVLFLGIQNFWGKMLTLLMIPNWWIFWVDGVSECVGHQRDLLSLIS